MLSAHLLLEILPYVAHLGCPLGLVHRGAVTSSRPYWNPASTIPTHGYWLLLLYLTGLREAATATQLDVLEAVFSIQ